MESSYIHHLQWIFNVGLLLISLMSIEANSIENFEKDFRFISYPGNFNDILTI